MGDDPEDQTKGPDQRTRPRVQAAVMGFLRRWAGVSLRDRVRSSAICEELGLGKVRVPTGRLGTPPGQSWSMSPPGKGSLGPPAGAAAPATPFRIS